MGTPGVRAVGAAIQALMNKGTDRSSSFRELVARIERTGWQVFVIRGRCPAREIVACLPHTIANVAGRILARVIIDEQRIPVAEDAIGHIAHELQHVVEAAEAGEVVDAASMRARFRQIGYVSLDGTQLRAYETDAAVQAGFRVQDEMYRARRPAVCKATGVASAESQWQTRCAGRWTRPSFGSGHDQDSRESTLCRDLCKLFVFQRPHRIHS